MNNDSWGLILFAFVALAAVFSFILVLGGPDEATGKATQTAKIGTSGFQWRDAKLACGRGTHCEDGLPGIPTGNYDPVRELYECRCPSSNPTFVMWRSVYQ